VPKGQVEVTFPQKGNKVVLAQQGELIGKVVQRAGMRVKFDCKVCRSSPVRRGRLMNLSIRPPPPRLRVTPAWCAQNGRCGTCQVRLNGRAAAKVCQGATVPGGATKKLTITLDNL